MKAMIFAAGLGTRLKPFTDHCPKALVQVNGKSLLERNIRYLQGYGIYDVIVNVHHFADVVINTLSDENGFGSRVAVSDERNELLETGGGLVKAAHYFAGEESFVVMNADVLTTLNLGKMIKQHEAERSCATLAVMKRPSSRELLFDDSMSLCGWRNNNTGEMKVARHVAPVSGYAFSGVQVMSAQALQENVFSGKFSLIDLYLHLAKTAAILGYDHTGDEFIDVGKPGSIEQASALFG